MPPLPEICRPALRNPFQCARSMAAIRYTSRLSGSRHLLGRARLMPNPAALAIDTASGASPQLISRHTKSKISQPKRPASSNGMIRNADLSSVKQKQVLTLQCSKLATARTWYKTGAPLEKIRYGDAAQRILQGRPQTELARKAPARRQATGP